ncbi:alkaline phosphatase family protein [Rhodanobacter denitrificans]|uniref:Alkaline phosphatase family protein n=1 Tax=Rhodanobacter denitrificans TaxID=666685 RepID=A0A368KKL7_9GAMM|nr:alkaline phosphatase family protein [Rhodanobacter denitrificans]RCS31656.1 alkaline phosphatase family protein [Rhodanobacter denitrificans]
MKKTSAAALAAAGLAAMLALPVHATMPASRIRHVLLVSVDGMHASDLDHYIRQHPRSTLAALAAAGVEYRNAHAVVPADSFPGLLGIMTGGTPAATGVYFDVSYDRRLSGSTADCKAGRTGTPVAFDEAADGAADAQGRRQLDPARLPHRPGACAPVYPHDYLRSNTVFSVVHAAGGYTAWIDKHPVYEILEGPDGGDIDDLYTPEIGGDYEGERTRPADHITGSIDRTERYDTMKAQALFNQIDGWTHDRSRRAPVPSLFGMNLQAVNVAQKLAGYADADGAPTAALSGALDHCDALLGDMVRALRARRLLDSTLIVVTAKHGNAPIDRAQLRHVDKQALRRSIEAAAPHGLAQLTADQGALVWLKEPGDAPRVAAALQQARQALGIRQVLQGPALLRFLAVSAADARTPDLLVVPAPGVIYGKPGEAKLAEHGGFDDDDTHVALLLSNPRWAHHGEQLDAPVSTTQLAPSMLTALGLSPDRLQAAKQQATKGLPGISWGTR